MKEKVKKELILKCCNDMFESLSKSVDSFSFNDIFERLVEVWVDNTYTNKDFKEVVENEIQRLEGLMDVYTECSKKKFECDSDIAQILEKDYYSRKCKKCQLENSLKDGSYVNVGRNLAIDLYSLV